MLEASTITLLARYNSWADETLFGAISLLPAEAVYKRTSTLFGSMIGTLNHNYQVDLIWRAHLLGESHGFRSRCSLLHPKFDDLVKAQIAMNQWLCRWANVQTPRMLRKDVSFRYISGEISKMRTGEIFLHLVNHKTYHRGWVCEMFFAEGRKPPETDLSVFVKTRRAISAASMFDLRTMSGLQQLLP